MVRADPDKFNENFEKIAKANPSLKWACENGMYVFGVDTPTEVILKLKDFSMEGVAEKIQCPTLILEAEEDKISVGQAKRLYDALTCEKTFMLFTSEEGAGKHCEAGAKLLSNERILSWVDEQLLNSASGK